jgi:hypothetical protein
MCGGSDNKSMLHTLPPGYLRTKVMFNSADGAKPNGDNSVVVFNLNKPLTSVVAMDWTNTDLWYQLVAQPALVSIDQLPNPNYTSSGDGYFAMILSGNNFIQRFLAPTEQHPRSYAQITFRISDRAGALITTLAPWVFEIEFIQKINN